MAEIRDLYGMKLSNGTFMIPQVKNGKIGLISPEKVAEIDSNIANLVAEVNKLKQQVAILEAKLSGYSPSSSSINVEKVDNLPLIVDANSNTIYMVPVKVQKNPDKYEYDEYILIDGESGKSWEILGQPVKAIEEKIMENKIAIDNDTINNLFN